MTVHFENAGVLISMLLDIIEVVCSHLGFNLAAAFAKILKEFGISNKASTFIEIEYVKLTRHAQILLITCDNASNNDAMIEALEKMVNDFPGAANQTCCFLHVLNLVVKSIIRQFDLPKSTKRIRNGESNDSNNEMLDHTTEELLRLTGNIDLEEEIMANNDEEENDNDEGWIDECEEMTADKLSELAASVRPVRLLLTKVRL